MSLKLMYITNRPDVALIAEAAGVDRIFIDMEYIGKSDRQGGMDTVQSRHTVDDIIAVRNVISSAEIMVRVNPIHPASDEYSSSEDEINAVINAGADVIMLPYFKTVDEVSEFLSFVAGRVRPLLLFETPESCELVDQIISLTGIDEVFIGLNDLSLGYKKKFMFELLADGTVESMCLKFRLKGLPYGFGGIAAVGKGMLPAERIIAEHYRLGSTCAILSRSFCNVTLDSNLTEVKSIFDQGVKEIRDFESECEKKISWFWQNREQMRKTIYEISESRL